MPFNARYRPITGHCFHHQPKSHPCQKRASKRVYEFFFNSPDCQNTADLGLFRKGARYGLLLGVSDVNRSPYWARIGVNVRVPRYACKWGYPPWVVRAANPDERSTSWMHRICTVIAERCQTRKKPRRVLRYAFTCIVLIRILVAWLGTGEASEQLPAETERGSPNFYIITIKKPWPVDFIWILCIY